MKQIQNFSFWLNGQTVIAEFLSLHINFDNLQDQAIFYYSLNDKDSNKLVDGNITMAGEDYKSWTGDNTYAWKFASNYLNLTIIN